MKQKIEANIFNLYDSENGAFFAATDDCRQIDIWGNAYMLYIGFPAKQTYRNVLQYLHNHADEYIFKGQIRHLLKGQYWNRMLIDVSKETYQNGAYWATATGWVAWCLYQIDKELGTKVLKDAITYLIHEGSFECVNDGYQKLPSFVVSATNVLGGLERMIREDRSALPYFNA